MTRGPISGIKHFATSLFNNAADTLRTTGEGIAHIGEMSTIDKIAAPVFLVPGIALTFMGATAGDPFALALGTYGTLRGAGLFFEHGESLGAKAAGAKPPEPPPPV
jgi:hypothetical protein